MQSFGNVGSNVCVSSETDPLWICVIAKAGPLCVVSFSTDFRMEVLPAWSMVTFSAGCTSPPEPSSSALLRS